MRENFSSFLLYQERGGVGQHFECLRSIHHQRMFWWTTLRKTPNVTKPVQASRLEVTKQGAAGSAMQNDLVSYLVPPSDTAIAAEA